MSTVFAMDQRLRRAALACLMLPLIAGAAQSQSVDADNPAAGAIQAAAQSATIHWQNVPLGDALTRLADVFDVAVFIDRRVDHSRRVDLKVVDASLGEILATLATKESLGVCQVGKVAYLGPASAAKRLVRTSTAMRDKLSREGSKVHIAINDAKTFDWPRLAMPRSLVAKVVEQRGWRIRNEALVPHDLWDANELPAMTLTDQLSLLLIGFDLSFKIIADERVIEIVPLKTVVAESDLPAVVEGHMPLDGQALSTTVEEGASDRHGTRPGSKTMQVYTLRIEEQPVGYVLRGLAQRLGWQLEIDEAAIEGAGLSLEMRVSFSVKNADEQELLRSLLAPAGLAFEMNGRRVLISAPAR